MRIISGKYKSRRFSLPKNFTARPTTEVAKEGLFNILNNVLEWQDTQALDLFGGSGAISVELTSRGCPQVVCVESNARHIAFIENVKKTLEINELLVIRADVFKYLKSTKQQFDFIFADPPYDLENLEEIPQLIFESNLLKDDGLFILEHPKNTDFSHLLNFDNKRTYGSVNFSIFKK